MNRILEVTYWCFKHWFVILATSVILCNFPVDFLLDVVNFSKEDSVCQEEMLFMEELNSDMPKLILYCTDCGVSSFVDDILPFDDDPYKFAFLLVGSLSILVARLYCIYDFERQKYIVKHLMPKEFDDNDAVVNYKESAYRFFPFYVYRYRIFDDGYVTCKLSMYSSFLKITKLFRAFLDLHNEGWRMKIFPCSEERIAEEKRLSEERGEEYVIYPDVEGRIAYLREEDDIIKKIGEL